MPDTPKLTFKGKPPTPEDLAKLAESKNQPIYDSLPVYLRAVLVPANPTSKAYTAVRGMYLAVGDELAQMRKEAGKPDTKTWQKQFNACKRKFDDAAAWLHPPLGPLSVEDATKVVKAFSASGPLYVDA